MPPKKDIRFPVEWHGSVIICKAQKGDLVTIGMDGTGPDGKRLVVQKRNGEDAEAAVWRKLQETAEVAAAYNHDSQRSEDAGSGGGVEEAAGQSSSAASSSAATAPDVEMTSTQNDDACEYDGPGEEEMDELRRDVFAELG